MKRIISVIMCLCVLCGTLVFVSPSEMTASAATQSELEDKIDEIDGKISANKKKLSKLKEDSGKQKEYLETLEDQIETVESKATNLATQIESIDGEITKLNTQIRQLNREIKVITVNINKTQKKITETQNNIEESSDLLAARLRAAYVNGDESTLKILMGSDSLASFLTRLEMMKRTSENDKKTIDDFEQKVITLNKSKAKLVDDKKELNGKKAEVNKSKAQKVTKKETLVTKQNEYNKTVSTLEGQYAEIENYIAELDKSSAAYQSYISELEKERAAADAEIDKIISMYYATSTKATTTTTRVNVQNNDENNQTNSYSTTAYQTEAAGGSYTSGESWAWPLGGASCYISSHYGNRSASISGWSFHGGTDITGGGIYGKPVYATRSGTVITAVNGYSGYGKYVIIDHGDGYQSLYGHCSSLTVSSGQKVSKGQMVARVGSSGNSTGPHLHFEIRKGGVKQNPMNYVRKP